MYGEGVNTADIRVAVKRRVNRMAGNLVMNEEYPGIFLDFQEKKNENAKEAKKG